MRLSLRCALIVGLLVALASPVLAAQAIHLAPKMPMSLDLAPLPRTFFMHSVDVNFTGGRAILASKPDGTGNLHTNDEFRMVVVHPDGTASWFRHDYAGSPAKTPGETAPVDITGMLQPGVNRVEIRLLDLYGSRFAANDYYIVTFAQGEAAPKAIRAKPYRHKPEAFIYAETPVFVRTSPGPIDLCIVSPAGGEQAVARIQVRGRLGGQPAPITLTLRPGFDRIPIPLGDLDAGTYTIRGTVQIGSRRLEIRPHQISRIYPPFTESDVAGILSDLAARFRADQAQVAAGRDMRAAAADALVTRALMERIRRARIASLPTETAADPGNFEARVRLLLSCSRLVESGATVSTIADELRVLQGQYLDWGRLGDAKMAAAPGRQRYEIGTYAEVGTYHNLAIYWANLPIAGLSRFVPLHSRKMEPVSAWPEVKRGARPITVAARPAVLFTRTAQFVRVLARTSRFDLDVAAPTTQAALRLAELALEETPITPLVADEILACLKPPVRVRGIRDLVNAASAAPTLLPAIKQSAALVAEGQFDDAAKAASGAALACDAGRALYAVGTQAPPDKAPPLPDKGPAIACWSEGPERRYLLLQYDSPAARREAAATLTAILDLLPGRQMLVGDLHQHSNVSDGTGDPQEMFFQTVSHFTDFHALTDHDTITGAQAIAADLPSWGLDYPFLIGEEVTRDFAHIVAIDPAATVDPKGEPNEVVKRIHDSGAVAILAHPWDTPFQKTYRKNPFAQPKMDAFQYNPEWYAEWQRKGSIPPMVEVTDTHDMSLAWPYRAIVFAEQAAPASIKKALLEGNCCAWTPIGPKGPDRITRVVWALISDREYYEEQQLARLVQRATALK
jgi:hypothetical protein